MIISLNLSLRRSTFSTKAPDLDPALDAAELINTYLGPVMVLYDGIWNWGGINRLSGRASAAGHETRT